MHGVFGLDRVLHFYDVCATQLRNLTRTSPLSKYIASMKTRRNVCTRMSSLSQATSGTPVNQERRGLLDYDVLDKNQNLICHPENIIPPMLKGTALNEESKCQPKGGGL